MKSIWLPCGLREADSEICDEGNMSYSSAFGGLTFKKYKKHGCIKVKKKKSYVSNKKLSLLVTVLTQLNILFWQIPGLTVFLQETLSFKKETGSHLKDWGGQRRGLMFCYLEDWIIVINHLF